MLFSDFMEFHGDRLFRDDPAVAGGIAMFGNIPVTVIAQVKGKTTKENVTRNFAMMSPEGYRKTLRLIRQAEKFGRPVICIVDTPGAFCGQEAEEHGQGEAIASNLYELSSIKVPIVSVLIGEGGSGGALALSVGNEVWMLDECDLQHFIAGRVCIDSLEGWQTGKRSERRHENYRAGFKSARRD